MLSLENSDEIWRDIPTYEGLYQVSNFGRVKSLGRFGYNLFLGRYWRRERILRPHKHSNGYIDVELCKDGIKTKFLVHRLVARAFIPNPENKPLVDHIDTDRTNNRAENLRWVDRFQILHKPLTMAKYRAAMALQRGGKNHKARSVINLDTNQVFETLTSAALASGVHRETLRRAILHGWKCAGCRWSDFATT